MWKRRWPERKGCAKMLNEAALVAEISRSGLFDADWYLAQNPDVAASGFDPILHYVRFGEREGRPPCSGFEIAGKTAGESGSIMYDHLMGMRQNKPAAKPLPVIFSTNDAYAPYLSVAIASIIHNAHPDKTYGIYVFVNELSAANAELLASLTRRNVTIRIMQIGEHVRDIVRSAKTCSHFTHEMYFRFLICSLLADYDKAVYLDCDLVVRTDVAELYEQDLDNNLLAAVRDTWNGEFARNNREKNLGIPNREYFNSGVLLMNLEGWRRENIQRRCLDLACGGKQYVNPDQDILNLVCRGRVKYLELGWNMMWQYYLKSGFHYSSPAEVLEFARHYKNPEVVHFNSEQKPWNTDDGLFSKFFWQYARFSPYFDQLRLECPYSPDNIITALEASEGEQ